MSTAPTLPLKALARALALTLGTSAAAHAALPNGIAAGEVTQNSALLWARGTGTDVFFEWSTDATFTSVLGSSTVAVSDPLSPVKLGLSGLASGTDYFYRATSGGGSAGGTFTTATAAGTYAGLRFGVSGDWRGELAPFSALNNAVTRDLDFFVALGDTIYADYPSPAVPAAQATTLEEYRLKHSEVYSTTAGSNTLGDLRGSTAWFATIDDHEVFNDFGGFGNPANPTNDSALYETGIQAFVEYNPIGDTRYADTGSDPRMDGEVDLYRNQSYGSDAVLITLDARSFRDADLPNPLNPLSPTDVGAFYAASMTADRTMLGDRQTDRLKQDLLAADQNGTTWKFVAVPEPIQNLGPVGPADRFEGYARERDEILAFVKDNDIKNVVFIAADIHGTLVNNLDFRRYQDVLTALGTVGNPFAAPLVPSGAWEISTGSVAFDAPFGPTVLDIASTIFVAPGITLFDTLLQGLSAQLGFPITTRAQFDTLPISVKDATVKGLVDQIVSGIGFSPVGLEDSGLDYEVLAGGFAALFTYGWTEFEIDPVTQALLVTTWGVFNYDQAGAAAAVAQQPFVVSQFRVQAQGLPAPVPVPAAAWLMGSAAITLGSRLRRRSV
jgi:alkaline phosphatase D